MGLLETELVVPAVAEQGGRRQSRSVHGLPRTGRDLSPLCLARTSVSRASVETVFLGCPRDLAHAIALSRFHLNASATDHSPPRGETVDRSSTSGRCARPIPPASTLAPSRLSARRHPWRSRAVPRRAGVLGPRLRLAAGVHSWKLARAIQLTGNVPPNNRMNLTAPRVTPLALSAPPHISSQGGGQGARHAARRLSRR